MMGRIDEKNSLILKKLEDLEALQGLKDPKILKLASKK